MTCAAHTSSSTTLDRLQPRQIPITAIHMPTQSVERRLQAHIRVNYGPCIRVRLRRVPPPSLGTVVRTDAKRGSARLPRIDRAPTVASMSEWSVIVGADSDLGDASGPLLQTARRPLLAVPIDPPPIQASSVAPDRMTARASS